MTKRDQMIECMDVYESGMSSIGETNGIWQNELVWWLCKGLKLLMETQVKTEDSHAHQEKQITRCENGEACPLKERTGDTNTDAEEGALILKELAHSTLITKDFDAASRRLSNGQLSKLFNHYMDCDGWCKWCAWEMQTTCPELDGVCVFDALMPEALRRVAELEAARGEAQWIPAEGGVAGEMQCSGCGALAGMNARGLHTVTSKFCRECGRPMRDE